MKEFSNLFQKEYDTEEVRYIPNMQQNYKYLNSPLSNGHLIDIICGENNKIVFVWDKSSDLDKLYQMWCKRELQKEVIEHVL